MNILYASTNLPFPPYSGGSQRTELLYRSLRELGSVDCIFVLPHLPPVSIQVQMQQRYNVKLILTRAELLRCKKEKWHRYFLPHTIKSDIDSFFNAGRYRWKPHVPSIDLLGSLDTYDLVVSRYLQSAAVFDLFRSRHLIIDLDDYDPDRLQLRLKECSPYKRLTLKRSLSVSLKAHRKLVKRLPHCWVSNPQDTRHPGLEQAHHLPNIPFPDNLQRNEFPTTNSQLTKPYFLMVGSMDYSANQDAVENFIQHVWPQVIKSHPDASFVIVGNNMTENQVKRWQSFNGVKPLGFVADLAPLYADALAVVAPIRFGAGTNIKVLEAAAFGCAILLTKVSHRGFESYFTNGESCLLSTTHQEMTSNCISLLKNTKLARQLGINAQAIVDKHFSYTSFRAAVHSLCKHAVSSEQGNTHLAVCREAKRRLGSG